MTAALTALPPAAPRPARAAATAPQGDFAQVLEQVSAQADSSSEPTTVRPRSSATPDGARTEGDAGAADDETAAAAGPAGASTATDVPATAPVVSTDALLAMAAVPAPAPAASATPVATDTAPLVPATGPAPVAPPLVAPATDAPAGPTTAAPTAAAPTAAPTVPVDLSAPVTAAVVAGADRPSTTAAPVSGDPVGLPATPSGTTPPAPAADQPVITSTVTSPTATAVPAAAVAPTAPAPTAPATPTAPAAPAQPTPPPLAEQLGARLTALTGPGGLSHGRHILTVPVDPENLGPVRIVAHIGPESVRVELVGATEASREALRGALSDLRRDLAASGLTVDVGPEGGRSDGREPGARDALPWQQGRMPTHEPGTPAPVAPDRPPSRGLDLLA